MTMVTSEERHCFFDGYVVAALWTATDEEGTSLEYLGYRVDDFSQDAVALMRADCDDFLESFGDVIAGLDYGFGNAMTSRDVFDAAGHDFLLTRNRHGAGFWDRGLGEVGDYLAEMSHPYGETWVYVGDDGKLHVS